MLLVKIFCVTVSVLFPVVAFTSYTSDSNTHEQTYDFSAADRLFAERANSAEGKKAIQKALALYHQALSSVSGHEMLYAVAQIARLHIYAGDMTHTIGEKDARMQIFDNCLHTLDEYLHPDKFGSTPEYYYYKIYCQALWGKSAGPIRILFRIAEFKRTIEEGLQLDAHYEGGGLKRMVGAVYLNNKAKLVDLYHPAEALALIESAIAAAAVENPAYPIPLGGTDIIENYYHYAEALLKNGRKAEALEVLAQTLAKYEKPDALPKGREPEAKHYLTAVKTRLEAYKDTNASPSSARSLWIFFAVLSIAIPTGGWLVYKKVFMSRPPHV